MKGNFVAGRTQLAGNQSYKFTDFGEAKQEGDWIIAGLHNSQQAFKKIEDLAAYYKENRNNPVRGYQGNFEHAVFFERKRGISIYNHSGQSYAPPPFLKWRDDGTYYCDLRIEVSDIEGTKQEFERARCDIGIYYGRISPYNPSNEVLSSNFVENLYYQREVVKEKSGVTKFFSRILHGHSEPTALRKANWLFDGQEISWWMAKQMIDFSQRVRNLVRNKIREIKEKEAQEQKIRSQNAYAQQVQNTKSRHNFGCVYILKNPAFPKLIKIGFTERMDAEDRAKELSSSSGLPYPFVVVYTHQAENPRSLEAILHTEFSQYRANQNREFFEIDAGTVIRFLMNLD